MLKIPNRPTEHPDLPLGLKTSGISLTAKARLSSCSSDFEKTDNCRALDTIRFKTDGRQNSRGVIPEATWRAKPRQYMKNDSAPPRGEVQKSERLQGRQQLGGSVVTYQCSFPTILGLVTRSRISLIVDLVETVLPVCLLNMRRILFNSCSLLDHIEMENLTNRASRSRALKTKQSPELVTFQTINVNCPNEKEQNTASFNRFPLYANIHSTHAKKPAHK